VAFGRSAPGRPDGPDPAASLTLAGIDARGLARALDLVQARGAVAQLCRRRHHRRLHLTERLTAGNEGARHQGEVADAIIAACT
jgi:hypothetical protein